MSDRAEIEEFQLFQFHDAMSVEAMNKLSHQHPLEFKELARKETCKFSESPSA